MTRSNFGIRAFGLSVKLVLGYGEFVPRTEQPTKCCEPLKKLRVMLGTCKIDLSPPVILYY